MSNPQFRLTCVRAGRLVTLLFTLSSRTFATRASPTPEASNLCDQRQQDTRTQAFFHWPELPTDASLELPSCGSPDGGGGSVWFEGHLPAGQRRLPLAADSGSLFDGCVDFRGLRRRDRRGLQLWLRPDRCRQLKGPPSLSLTCAPAAVRQAVAAVAEAQVHVLQLAGDPRCPPGTGRDRLGLCRQCGDNRGRRCCQQPFWDAECPLSCGRRGGYGRDIGDGDEDDYVAIDLADDEPEPRQLLHREKRAAAVLVSNSSSYAAVGKVKVAQLSCPKRLSVVRTAICLTEMHYPTRGEVISLMVVAFTTVAFLSMPLFVLYVMGQVYAAGFLPFLQFHLFERAALLSSGMRTQIICAPSLWDFKAFREAEKQRRLLQEQIEKKQLSSFRMREFHNLLLWDGVPAH